MNSKPNFTNNSWKSHNRLLAPLALALTVSARAETQPAAIPISEIGARATANYQGDALGVTATADGARLRCGFQKLEGNATPEGLWLESTKPGGGQLRLVAMAVGRGEALAGSGQGVCAEGTSENSPAFQRWERCGQAPSREATAGLEPRFSRPFGTSFVRLPNPALKRWAIVKSPSGTELPHTGKVSVNDKLVRFTRPGLTEEYSVSVDGVRQDFVIESPPLDPPPCEVLSTLRSATEDELRRTGQHSTLRSNVHPPHCYGGRATEDGSTLNQSAGDLRVELTLSGARAEAAAGGARLTLEGAGRTLAYGRLRVEDATGRELMARLEVLSDDRLAVSVADANATYPVRIDPTFSDADWVSLNPSMPGANGVVRAIAVDGDGNVYVGGDFTVIGTVVANHIALWRGSAWSALGSGVSGGGVLALAVNGTDLYAGGWFITAGGLPANYIAKWNGSAWSALGSVMGYGVYALAVRGADIYAGGDFWTVGGVTTSGVAKWDGSAWSALGSGLNAPVYALAVSGTDLYAGGTFGAAGGVTANHIAKWDGSTWSALGSGIGGSVSALAASGTDLYAGGGFTTAGGVTANNIAKWDGSAWSALGSELGVVSVSALAVSGTDLYACGSFRTAGGVTVNGCAKWDGSAWSALGSWVDGGGWVYGLAVSGSNLYAWAGFTPVGGGTTGGIVRWDGSAWSALSRGLGMNDTIRALAVSGTNLYAGGYFTTAGGVTANYVAEWDGSVWSALGSGMNSSVSALAVSGTNLYAGGWFTTAGGVPAITVAKWNGSAWSALGSGMGGSSYPLALAASGTNLYAGGDFTVPAYHIAKWNGSSWSALGGGIGGSFDSYVAVLAVSGTDLYAGGDFTMAGTETARYIAKWNGSSWSALGSGMSGGPNPCVFALAVSGTNLYAGGRFTTAGGVPASNIAKWNGSSWSALGSGLNSHVTALAVSGTSLYAGGDFTSAGGTSATNIAKWDGTAWSALGSSGVSGGSNPGVRALAADGAGHLFVGGSFSLAGTNVSPYIAQADLGSVVSVVTSPQSQTAEVGATVDFAVDASGGDLAYQWFSHSSNSVSLGTKSQLVLTNVQFSQSGTYTVVVTYLFGPVTSPPVMLNVIAPVDRKLVLGVNVMGQVGSLLGLDYRDNLGPSANWETMATMTLSNSSQFYPDVSQPLPPQRFYRAWQTGTPGVRPSLDLHPVPAITLTGSIGHSVRLDYINQFGPTDAWVRLDTVPLTNTSQLYFDTSAWQQPPRLYRLVPSP